jgi:hypothetical protein
MDNSSKKFSVGSNGQQCIGPCYPAGFEILHPITLQLMTNPENPFCPTTKWVDPIDNKIKWTDLCIVSENDKLNTDNKQSIDYILPTLGINSEIFLKTYYKIYSFESALDYIFNDNLPLYTQLRIINCAWKVYGYKAEIINDQLINFYINLIKKEWIKDIYPQIANLIYVDGKNIYFKENKSTIEDKQIEKINFFNKKLNTTQIIYKILILYINENKSNWKDIIDHNENIKNTVINYMVNKINSTIDHDTT